MSYTKGPARREELLRRLSEGGYVSSGEVSAEFGVSEMTIRRDLRQLELDGHVARVFGGARLADGSVLSFEQRDETGSVEKRAIAAACARELHATGIIALDAGTTVAPVARLIQGGATVVTHSVPVISSCAERDDIDLIALGGAYQPSTRSFTGPIARSNLEMFSVDVAVLSATAVDAAGMLCASSLDAEIKQSMTSIATRTILLVDHSKIGGRAPIRFGQLSMVDLIITDSLATSDQVQLLRSGGAHVLVAEVEKLSVS